MFKNICNKIFGTSFHIHDFENWKINRFLTDDCGMLKLIQSRQCKDCGWIEIKHQEV